MIPQAESGSIGKIRNITFSNIIAESESGIVVYGQKPGDISDVSFDNLRLRINKSPLNTAYGGNFDLRPVHDKRLAVFKHDIPALFCRHVDGLVVSHLELHWDDSLSDFFSHAICCEHFCNVLIEAFHGRQPLHGDQRAAIALSHG